MGGGVLPCVCVCLGASRWLRGIQGRSIQHLSLAKLLQEQPAGDCRRNPSPVGKARPSVPPLQGRRMGTGMLAEEDATLPSLPENGQPLLCCATGLEAKRGSWGLLPEVSEKQV